MKERYEQMTQAGCGRVSFGTFHSVFFLILKQMCIRDRYITDTTEFQIEEPTIVTLGKFDGRHRGHQKLLRTMKELKQELGYPTAIFTFSIAPLTQMSGQPQTVITTNMERRANMERMGIDYLVEYPFNEEIRRMMPEDFVKDILAGRMGARELSLIHISRGTAQRTERKSRRQVRAHLSCRSLKRKRQRRMK